jgi:hypothetical protein
LKLVEANVSYLQPKCFLFGRKSENTKTILQNLKMIEVILNVDRPYIDSTESGHELEFVSCLLAL